MLTFEELYDSYYKDVYRFTYWLIGNREDAEDLTSETFIRAWSNHHRINAETMKGYLFAIARNFYIDQFRKKKKKKEIKDSHRDPAILLDKKFEIEDEIRNIHLILNTFHEIDRSAFLLRVESELPYDEIARILEISVSSAKVKVHRIRKRIIAERNK